VRVGALLHLWWGDAYGWRSQVSSVTFCDRIDGNSTWKGPVCLHSFCFALQLQRKQILTNVVAIASVIRRLILGIFEACLHMVLSYVELAQVYMTVLSGVVQWRVTLIVKLEKERQAVSI